MKLIRAALVTVIFIQSAVAVAQTRGRGILPGEPDPTTAPGHNHGPRGNVLLDDRRPCPEGMRRFQKMKCANPDEQEPECMNYAPVLECLKRAERLNCEKPQIPMPVYKCKP